MRLNSEKKWLYSPSDCMTYLSCKHASNLNKRSIQRQEEVPFNDTTAQLLQEKGLEHEREYLERYKSLGKEIVEIAKKGSLEERSNKTIEAMKQGIEIIYQASFFLPPWVGDADFIIKVPQRSQLGEYSYEALDTKLARVAEPKHLVQLCFYSEGIEAIQGYQPQKMHVVLGNGKQESFLVQGYQEYYKQIKRDFEQYIKQQNQDDEPEPCNHCKVCPWLEQCTQKWEQEQHLSLVANIRKTQIEKLKSAGIHTLEQLAQAKVGEGQLGGINRDIITRLQSQASLQYSKRLTGEIKYQHLPLQVGKGFNRIPEPDVGDLFFDMEGDPLYSGGLEYLFGVYFIEEGQEIFKPFWGHNHQEEKVAFKEFMEFLDQHLTKYPRAHIYHYNHYETTALKRLSGRYAICEEQLDNLLREEVFCDLYEVVRDGIQISESGYSIKNLEVFYLEKRQEQVATAVESIVVYNKWRQTQEQQFLDDIEEYNKVDCISTYYLREWLVKIRPESTTWWKSERRNVDEGDKERKEWEIEHEKYQERIEKSGIDDEVKQRLCDILEFHNREAKPQWWNMFERKKKWPEELIEDTECLANLKRVEVFQEGKGEVHRYHFPNQEYKLKVGSQVTDVEKAEFIGSIVRIEEQKGLVDIKVKRTLKEPLKESHLSIGPGGPISCKGIREALYRYADTVIHQEQKKDCATEILKKSKPRFKRREQELRSGSIQEISETISQLDQSYMFIQGPPGAGKTYTTSHVIVDLLRWGKTVGVTSNSHKAIHNVLRKVEQRAKERGVSFQGVKKSSSKESQYQGESIKDCLKVSMMDIDTNQLFAGTVWTLTNKHFTGRETKPIDYLFIDEAGQVALANVIAMATVAENIILVGDQMQLGSPIQGVHPGESGTSILEFLLEDHQTIPPDRGIFLDKTYRMRPSLCRFISKYFYESRLESHESTTQRRLQIEGKGIKEEGIEIQFVEHQNCFQKSIEEGERIKEMVSFLIHQELWEGDKKRKLTKEDILVVTPYTVQVNYLQSIVEKGVRVGTVDKFQGQEAPIVLISMVASDGSQIPRGMEFLYSKNRLNVALSRAQCLAVIFLSPKLLSIACQRVEQMELVNTFCGLIQ